MRHRVRLLGLSFVIIISAVFETACTLHRRIYNLTTGEVTPVTITYGGSGRGRISGVVTSSGEKMSGEYLTYAHLPVNWGSVYAKVYGTEGSAFQAAHHSGNQISTGLPS